MATGEQEIPATATESEVSQLNLVIGDLSWGRRIVLASALLVIVVLVLLGMLHVARGFAVRGVAVEDVTDLPSVDNPPHFARTLELLSNARLTHGNTIEVLLNGDGTFPRIWRDIDAARYSVTVQMYYSTPGRLVDSLAAHLIMKAREGVRVLLLFDAFGSRKLHRSWLTSLREAGVTIAHIRPLRWYKLDRVSHRSHVRSVVVDGQVGYTGGFGFGDFWLGDGISRDQWRETNVRVTGPAVLQLQATFMAGWAEATGELLSSGNYFPAAPDSTNGMLAGLFTFFPNTGSSSAERFLALTIASARKRLYIANSYFVPDVQFREMLTAAAARGVDVRILTAGKDTDVPPTRIAARACYEELLKGGVRIYEYRNTMLHSKTLVMDGQWSSVGSLNFDNRSMAYNDESNIVVLDPVFGGTLDSLFLADLGRADEIQLSAFQKRSLLERWLEAAFSMISGIL